MATTGYSRLREQVEQRRRERRQRKIPPVGGSLERPRCADERPRDHAAHAVADAYEIERDLTKPIQLRHRHDVLVRGDLEDAVGGGVDNRRAGSHVFRSQLVDDGGARRCLVAERATPDARFEGRHDVGRETVGEHRKRTIEHEPHQLPVPGHRVLPWRRLGHPSECRAGRRFRLHAVDKRDAPEAETAECREAQANMPGNVTERVAPGVAVRRGVGQFANADAVENDQDDACRRGQRGSQLSALNSHCR